MPAQPSVRRSGVAVAALFVVNGATFSNWLPRIPEIRDRLGLDNAGLGATLLGGGLGGIVGSLLVGRAMAAVGSRRLVVAAASALSVGLALIAVVPSAVLLLVLLTALGALDVFNDAAMNAQGVVVQQRLGRQIMNRLHAMWSLGFTGGAVVGSAASAAGLGLGWHLTAAGAVLLASVLAVRHWLVPADPAPPAPDRPEAAGPGDGPAPARSRRVMPVVVAMSIAAFTAAVLEVTPNDWAAVFLRDVFDAGRLSGLGTVACAGAMLLGRLGGDHVLERVGEARLLRGALGLVGAGLAITVVAPGTAVALVGLAVWGLGLSVVFPQLYAAAARLPGTSAGAGLGSMLLGQRIGSMVTAAGTGAIAEWSDLRVAFAAMCATSLAVLALVARSTAPEPAGASPG